jgi:hypothetical protein
MAQDNDVVEVFATRDPLAAQAAIDEVLRPAGIDGFVHDRVSHMIPAATLPGGYFVAVPGSQLLRAVEALRDALQVGTIDGELTTTFAGR